MFTLPLGYRPARAVTVPVVANNVFGVGEVMPDGSVFVGIGSSAYTYLDSVQFHV